MGRKGAGTRGQRLPSLGVSASFSVSAWPGQTPPNLTHPAEPLCSAESQFLGKRWVGSSCRDGQVSSCAEAARATPGAEATDPKEG